MEEYSPHIVKVAVECEQASSALIRPNLDLVVVSSRNEERLCFVKVYASDRTIMFLESVDQCTHAIVPQLDGRRMQRNENPWPDQCQSPNAEPNHQMLPHLFG